MGTRSVYAPPGVGVLAVVWHAGRVVLVRRRNAPQAGRWGFPGGRVEPGESVRAAAQRELWEETGIRARPVALLEVVEAMGEGMHWVLVPVLCAWESGVPVAASDVDQAGWFPPDALPTPLCDGLAAILHAGPPRETGA
ncbi:NUDIX hydrolase [Pararhodospirillum photometricum]|nr:NUDIX hydrolase [Pararhodospirillum photometricum]